REVAAQLEPPLEARSGAEVQHDGHRSDAAVTVRVDGRGQLVAGGQVPRVHGQRAGGHPRVAVTPAGGAGRHCGQVVQEPTNDGQTERGEVGHGQADGEAAGVAAAERLAGANGQPVESDSRPRQKAKAVAVEGEGAQQRHGRQAVGQAGQPVAAEVEASQGGEAAELRAEPGQAVVAEVQHRQTAGKGAGGTEFESWKCHQAIARQAELQAGVEATQADRTDAELHQASVNPTTSGYVAEKASQAGQLAGLGAANEQLHVRPGQAQGEPALGQEAGVQPLNVGGGHRPGLAAAAAPLAGESIATVAAAQAQQRPAGSRRRAATAAGAAVSKQKLGLQQDVLNHLILEHQVGGQAEAAIRIATGRPDQIRAHHQGDILGAHLVALAALHNPGEMVEQQAQGVVKSFQRRGEHEDVPAGGQVVVLSLVNQQPQLLHGGRVAAQPRLRKRGASERSCAQIWRRVEPNTGSFRTMPFFSSSSSAGLRLKKSFSLWAMDTRCLLSRGFGCGGVCDCCCCCCLPQPECDEADCCGVCCCCELGWYMRLVAKSLAYLNVKSYSLQRQAPLLAGPWFIPVEQHVAVGARIQIRLPPKRRRVVAGTVATDAATASDRSRRRIVRWKRRRRWRAARRVHLDGGHGQGQFRPLVRAGPVEQQVRASQHQVVGLPLAAGKPMFIEGSPNRNFLGSPDPPSSTRQPGRPGGSVADEVPVLTLAIVQALLLLGALRLLLPRRRPRLSRRLRSTGVGRFAALSGFVQLDDGGRSAGPSLQQLSHPADCRAAAGSCLRPVTVVLRLERAVPLNAQVGGLFASQLSQPDAQVLQVSGGDLLVQLLGQEVDAQLVLLGPQLDLGQHLVGERVGHHEAGMAVGAAEVHQATLGQQDDVPAVGQGEPVDLRLDGVTLGVLHQPGHVQLAVEVADVAHDGVLQHPLEVLAPDDAGAAGGGDDDARPADGLVNGGHLVAFHGCLQRRDGVDLGHDDPGAEGPQSLGAALANVAIAGNQADLAGQHDVSGPLDAINQRLAAAVQVVELGLGDRVVHIDGWGLQLASGQHLVEVVHSGGGLLRQTLDARQVLREFLVHQVGEVAAIIKDHVERLAIWEHQAYTGTPVLAMAAAAKSCVEKMLQEDHCTWAPRAVRVSMSTAVCTVMCRQPAIRAPFSGCWAPYFFRRAMRPGISFSAISMALRPQSARLISAVKNPTNCTGAGKPSSPQTSSPAPSASVKDALELSQTQVFVVVLCVGLLVLFLLVLDTVLRRRRQPRCCCRYRLCCQSPVASSPSSCRLVPSQAAVAAAAAAADEDFEQREVASSPRQSGPSVSTCSAAAAAAAALAPTGSGGDSTPPWIEENSTTSPPSYASCMQPERTAFISFTIFPRPWRKATGDAGLAPAPKALRNLQPVLLTSRSNAALHYCACERGGNFQVFCCRPTWLGLLSSLAAISFGLDSFTRPAPVLSVISGMYSTGCNLFGHETSTKLQSASVKGVDAGSLQAYIVGNACLAVASCEFPKFAIYEDRLRALQLQSDYFNKDSSKEHLELLAVAGAIELAASSMKGEPQEQQQRCFCCGSGAPCCSDACPVARLLRLLPATALSGEHLHRKSPEATTAAAVDQFCQLLASIWHRLQDSIAARIAVTFGFEMPDLLLAVLARCCSQPGKEGSVEAGQIGPLVDQLQAGDLISSVYQYLTDGGYCGEVWATLRWKLLPDAVDALLGMGKADSGHPKPLHRQQRQQRQQQKQNAHQSNALSRTPTSQTQAHAGRVSPTR
uniref:RING-type domain-containing protein n=1 Tax=Macrostomum lignano TaxID=282301 RepID=A0A1I8I4J5_9PLAT